MLTVSLAKDLLRGGLPFAFDDPDNDDILKPLLMNCFGGAEMGTSKDQFSARCSPLATANYNIVEDLSSISVEKLDNKNILLLKWYLCRNNYNNHPIGIYAGQCSFPSFINRRKCHLEF